MDTHPSTEDMVRRLMELDRRINGGSISGAFLDAFQAGPLRTAGSMLDDIFRYRCIFAVQIFGYRCMLLCF